MEVLIHFISTLIKIAILSSIYALLALLIFKFIAGLKPDCWFDRVSVKKIRLWLFSFLFFSVGLLSFLFTYWGYHGFGDGPQIPIGKGEIIANVNWEDNCSLENRQNTHGEGIDIETYYVVNDKLCAKYDDKTFYDYTNAYFIYDLETKRISEFKTELEFKQYILTHALGSANQLQSFRKNYLDYWGGWRLWLLA